jgi:hypothetical protein
MPDGPSNPTINTFAPSTLGVSTKPTKPTKPTIDTTAPSTINSTAAPSTISSMAPGSTAAPGGADSTRMTTPFTISYTLDLFRVPSDTDYTGVTALTGTFLETYFKQYFSNVTTVHFTTSVTSRMGETFNGPTQPLSVEYNSTLSFKSDSASIPTTSELDRLVANAFAASGGQALYLTQLRALTINNLFQSTTAITFAQGVTKAASPSGNGSAISGSLSAATTAGLAVAAGAGAFILLAAGIMVVRRRGGDEREQLGKYTDGDGHMTVSGDTYTGAASMDSQSIQQAGVEHRQAGSWANQSHFSASSHRPHSPAGLEEGCESDESGPDSPPVSPRQMSSIDL